MITNCKVTLYTKTPAGAYVRTVAAAFWRDGKTVRTDKLVVSVADITTVKIPFADNPPLAIGVRDYLVRGVCAAEPPTEATLGGFLKAIGARSISAAEKLDYGSTVMHHWALEVGA